MNFTVILNADTSIGHIVAFEMARQKRNLILLGKNIKEIEELRSQIRKYHLVQLYGFELIKTSRNEIVKLCDYINDHFFVERMIDIAEQGLIADWCEPATAELEHQLTGKLIPSLVILHQLLPNLLLCADSELTSVICKENQLPSQFVTYKFLETGTLIKAANNFFTDVTKANSEDKCPLPDKTTPVSI